MERRRVLISDIPPQIQGALVADQPERPINDLVSEILSHRYSLAFESSGRAGRNWKADDTLVLKLPEAIWVAMKEEAMPYGTIKQVAITALAEHYRITI